MTAAGGPRASHSSRQPILQTDVGLSILLASLVLAMFVVYPLVPLHGVGRLVINVAFSLILVGGSLSLADQPRRRVTLVTLAALALVARWTAVASGGTLLWTLDHVVNLTFLTATAAGLLVKVLRPGQVTIHRLQGAVAFYLLLGLIWAFAYSLVEIRLPGSFELPDTARVEAVISESGGESYRETLMHHFVYFSFVTLTTLGYGDVRPITPPAQTLSILEALVGQLYLAILVGRLVSLHIAHSSSPANTSADPPA